jgi:hypothetical protein
MDVQSQQRIRIAWVVVGILLHKSCLGKCTQSLPIKSESFHLYIKYFEHLVSRIRNTFTILSPIWNSSNILWVVVQNNPFSAVCLEKSKALYRILVIWYISGWEMQVNTLLHFSCIKCIVISQQVVYYIQRETVDFPTSTTLLLVWLARHCYSYLAKVDFLCLAALARPCYTSLVLLYIVIIQLYLSHTIRMSPNYTFTIMLNILDTIG